MSATASKNRYNNKHYDRLYIMLPKGTKDQVKERAKAVGLSVNAYIVSLIRKDRETM